MKCPDSHASAARLADREPSPQVDAGSAVLKEGLAAAKQAADVRAAAPASCPRPPAKGRRRALPARDKTSSQRRSG